MNNLFLLTGNDTIEQMQKVIDYYDIDMKHIKRSYTLQNGMKDGLFTEYFINGKISLMKEYRMNTLVGTIKEYYENGRLKTSVNYYRGKQHGQQIIYYSNGNICKIIQYRYGQPHGKWFSYYDSDKLMKVKSVDYFLYGRSIKKSMTYYENGVLKSLITFSCDGNRNGVCKRFYDTQQLKSSKYYVNDKLNGETVEYYRNGNKKRVLYHLEGKLNGTVYKFSDNNCLQFKCHYIDNKRDGYSLEYYTSRHRQLEPILKRAVLYHQGQKTGKAFLYDENGNPTYIFEYQNDKFHGIQICMALTSDNNESAIKERYIIHNKMILEKRDLLQDCSICYENGQTWKTPCGHYICLDCCHKCYNNHEMTRLQCFYCRTSFKDVNYCSPVLIFH